MNPDEIIGLRDVRKVFRDFWLRPTVAAVDGLSLSVARGEVFGLLGPNGSGKSTTIKMILGLLAPSSGSVTLFGLSPKSVKARAKLGYLPELSYLHPFLTPRETLRYYAGLNDLPSRVAKARAAELLKMVKLEDVADRTVSGFSKGMARRVALASSLIGRPELLVLDEPTSGLDPVSTKEVKLLIKALAKSGMTVLMTSHLLADAEDVCDRVAILDRGEKVAEGKVSELGGSLEEFFLAKVGDADDFEVAEFLK